MDYEEYYEKLQAELETRPPIIRFLESFFSVVAVLAIVTGNSLVLLATFRNRQLRKPANFYVVSLAFTDLLAGLFAYPLTSTATISGAWTSGKVGCYWVFIGSYTFANASILTMLLIAVNRYFKIVRSNTCAAAHAPKAIVSSIVIAWLLALGCPLVLLCWGSDILFNPGYMTCVPVSARPKDAAVFYTVSSLWAGLPILLTSLLYFKIWVFIRNHNARMNGSRVNPDELKLTKSLWVVVGCFLACYLPYVATATLEVSFKLQLPRQYYFFGGFMVMSASYANPFIYAAMNRRFRKEFFNILSFYRGTTKNTVRPL